MTDILYYLLAAPALTAIAAGLTKSQRFQEMANLVGASVTLVLGAIVTYAVVTTGPQSAAGSFLYADALSALLILVVSLIGFACAMYSIGYMRHEVHEDHFPAARLRLYYVLFHAFVFTMLLVAVSNNLGIMWISIEGTTLASAFLVGFYRQETSLEAAWKYLIIGSVGITLALFGTILVYFSAVHVLGPASGALEWTTLIQIAGQLDPLVLKIAFVFVLIGYGTKAGLAPMHTWLPDAHSQAPTPVSAMLSAVLLNCALYGILRFHAIVSPTLGSFSNTLLILFGLVSLGIAVPFVLIAKDYKRLLAYSSVEHVGIIALAIGIGTPLALFGGLLHIFNHAIAKSLMFFVAGNLNAKYGTRRIDAIRGALLALPATGIILLAGFLAITGSPPFSVFVSEFTILNAGFASGHYVAVTLYLLFLLLIFAGFLMSMSRMAFGKPPEGMPRREVSPWNTAAMVFLLAFVVVMGVYLPAFFVDLLHQAGAVIAVVK
ncbi:MAG: hydrogenase 4 subunit F [Candidatus Thermoplasmatota archaeon]